MTRLGSVNGLPSSPAGDRAGSVGESAGFAYEAGAASRAVILSGTVVVSLAIAIVATASCLDSRPPPLRTYAVSIPSAHDHAPGHLDVDGRS